MSTKFLFNRHCGKEGVLEKIYTKDWKGPCCALCLELFTRWQPRGWGGTLVIFGWGCAAGTLEPLAYTRASSSEFCYPVLD